MIDLLKKRAKGSEAKQLEKVKEMVFQCLHSWIDSIKSLFRNSRNHLLFKYFSYSLLKSNHYSSNEKKSVVVKEEKGDTKPSETLNLLHACHLIATQLIPRMKDTADFTKILCLLRSILVFVKIHPGKEASPPTDVQSPASELGPKKYFFVS